MAPTSSCRGSRRGRRGGLGSRAFTFFSFLIALVQCSYMPVSFGQDTETSAEVAKCLQGTGHLSLRLKDAATTLKFKCDADSVLLPIEIKQQACGNTACTKPATFSSLEVQEVKNGRNSEVPYYTLKVKGPAPKDPATVYLFCGPQSGERGFSTLRELQDAKKTCIIQVSVWGTDRATVPADHKCTNGKPISAKITADSSTASFQCGEKQTLQPVLYENVLVDAKEKDASQTEKEVALQSLVESAVLNENGVAVSTGTRGGNNENTTDVAYILSVATLPAAPQTFFYKCVASKAEEKSRTQTQEAVKDCKVTISVTSSGERVGRISLVAFGFLAALSGAARL
ncbi:SAG-related sequence SRS49B [Besnoitia besnoiti]|uniref:SAG-related sequence SRS49B n=1 Tax=Besnoitia besnoiti TaxID=94643 RepID=A0A2A9MLI1_BESBE|nr:SAG-related sequence SRS49B [Besnoitia besnoiti]PFH36886.1 SAG-related sequence SRS49B [Besnoitia besnoiti]